MTIRFSLDRFEGDYAVCYDEQGNKFDFPRSLVPLEAGSLFTAKLDEKRLPVDIHYLAEETAQKRSELKGRLHALFHRTKKQ